jgi:hypothetical protein
MKRNWKTSLLGLGSIITGVALFLKGNQVEALSAISSGIGLLFSKDHDKTGA